MWTKIIQSFHFVSLTFYVLVYSSFVLLIESFAILSLGAHTRTNTFYSRKFDGERMKFDLLNKSLFMCTLTHVYYWFTRLQFFRIAQSTLNPHQYRYFTGIFLFRLYVNDVCLRSVVTLYYTKCVSLIQSSWLEEISYPFQHNCFKWNGNSNG